MGSILTLPSRGAPERQPSAGLDILVRNTASVSADVWFRGSGPLARVPAHGETTVRVLGPGALTVTSRADETAGVIVTLVESSLGALQSGALRCALPPGGRAPADTPRGGARALLLSVPPLRVLVRVFARIVGAQRALRARRTAALNAARVRRAAAATTMQRYARRLLARVLRPCEICLEDVPRGVLVRIGECEVHRACMRCVHTYVALQLLDGRLHVRCPGVACSCVVEAHTLVEYVTREAFKLYEERLCAVHTARLMGEDDEGFLAFCRAHARRCPTCGVLIWRSSGCVSMRCVCGGTFNWDSSGARVKLDASPRAPSSGPDCPPAER
ncbi:hypothetical protein KFE25_013243 [Diacronema lutheri]|uniref:RING-type domain-containing protein n=1 Tax=Diacronema lutheri TaxID=2081491 RepID=A0A8J5X7J4_DIALT|nr:hypothetical protein KFE25_013243 [Diacronema lutheri]